jgi:hypothetical protein
MIMMAMTMARRTEGDANDVIELTNEDNQIVYLIYLEVVYVLLNIEHRQV